jgi:hypothetical protein
MALVFFSALVARWFASGRPWGSHWAVVEEKTLSEALSCSDLPASTWWRLAAMSRTSVAASNVPYKTVRKDS